MKMKKLLLTLLATSTLALGGCNANPTLGSFSFHYVHIQMYGMTQATHLKIVNWRDSDGGIELKVNNYGSIWLGDGTYMLYDTETCPICGKVEYR